MFSEVSQLSTNDSQLSSMNHTLIFLVLAGLALIFKWLTSHGSGNSEKPEPPSPNEQAPPPHQPAQSDEERIRRFLEALGAPPGTRPPAPVRPRRVVTPAAPPAQRPKAKRSWVQPLPPLVTTPEDLALRRQRPPRRSSRSWPRSRHPSPLRRHRRSSCHPRQHRCPARRRPPV